MGKSDKDEVQMKDYDTTKASSHNQRKRKLQKELLIRMFIWNILSMFEFGMMITSAFVVFNNETSEKVEELKISKHVLRTWQVRTKS